MFHHPLLSLQRTPWGTPPGQPDGRSRGEWTATIENGTTLVTNTYDGTALANRDYLAEHDPAYGTSFTVRGNLTQQVTPGVTTCLYQDNTTTITDLPAGSHVVKRFGPPGSDEVRVELDRA